MRRIKRLRGRHWRLLGVTLALMVCLTMDSSLAADLVIDGGRGNSTAQYLNAGLRLEF